MKYAYEEKQHSRINKKSSSQRRPLKNTKNKFAIIIYTIFVVQRYLIYAIYL
jgi:hypothetical protein